MQRIDDIVLVPRKLLADLSQKRLVAVLVHIQRGGNRAVYIPRKYLLSGALLFLPRHQLDGRHRMDQKYKTGVLFLGRSDTW